MMNSAQIKQCFETIDYDALSDEQHKTVCSLEEQFLHRGFLSKRQQEVLRSIYRQSLAQEPLPPWARKDK